MWGIREFGTLLKYAFLLILGLKTGSFADILLADKKPQYSKLKL
jgi:hypothetical protein